MAKIIISLILCLLAVASVEAQQVVTGQITNEYDGTPIPDASVFIAHTTIVTQSDRYGNFSLTVPIQGSFQVIVSHIGFQSASRTIDTPQVSHQVNFALQEHILQEIVVMPCIPHRRKDENLFWQTILGERPSNRRMQVLNPEAVRFCLTATDILRVFADEPIEIINHTMGYHISYVLRIFEHNYQNEETFISGMPLFTELTPQSDRQRNQWKSRRQEAYSVSLTRFIRALYQEQLHENGFFLAKEDLTGQSGLMTTALAQSSILQGVVVASRANMIPLTLAQAHILQRDEEAVRVNITQSIFLACISRPVTYEMFGNPNRTMFNRRATFPIIKLLPSDIIIYSDGSYSGVLNISEFRNSITGLRAGLPIEYRVK